MLFYAFEFIFFFLPVVLVMHYLIAARMGHKAAMVFLVLASLVFYGSWSAKYLLLLVPSMVVNYYLGLHLQKTRARLWLWGGILLNLGLLGYYKYTNFFLGSLDSAFGTHLQVAQIVLPIGISFYTFQQLAWLVDSFSGKVKTLSEGFWRYALFVTFFPQLVAGPIVHHAEMMPQFSREESFRFRWQSLSIGLTIFIIGLFKKVVIADSMAAIASPIFAGANTHDVAMADAWLAAMAFTLQVYFDFSGYSDMAIGLARMFNIRLPMNFNSPLKAVSLIELWERWHMTMTRFFQTYVHVPLSVMLYRRQMQKGMRGNAAIHAATFITLLAIGVWHGASWNFIVFGMMNGVFILCVHFWRGFRKKQGIAPLPRGFSIGLTVFFFMLTCVVYRAVDLQAAGQMYTSMFTPAVFLSGGLLGAAAKALSVTAVLFVALLLPNTQQVMRKYRPVYDTLNIKRVAHATVFGNVSWRPQAVWLIFSVALYAYSLYTLLDANKVQEFIYFQF